MSPLSSFCCKLEIRRGKSGRPCGTKRPVRRSAPLKADIPSLWVTLPDAPGPVWVTTVTKIHWNVLLRKKYWSTTDTSRPVCFELKCSFSPSEYTMTGLIFLLLFDPDELPRISGELNPESKSTDLALLLAYRWKTFTPSHPLCLNYTEGSLQWPGQTSMRIPSTHIRGSETTDLLLTLLAFSFNESLLGDQCYSRHPNCLTVCCGFGSCFRQVEMARCFRSVNHKMRACTCCKGSGDVQPRPNFRQPGELSQLSWINGTLNWKWY